MPPADGGSAAAEPTAPGVAEARGSATEGSAEEAEEDSAGESSSEDEESDEDETSDEEFDDSDDEECLLQPIHTHPHALLMFSSMPMK